MKTDRDTKPSYRVGAFVVDGRTREITKNGLRVHLTPTEFGVLYEVVERRGNVILRDDFRSCASRGYPDRRHPVDEHVSSINGKLGTSIIVPERGVGYKLSSKLPAEIIATPSFSELERQLAIALEQINDHSAASFRAAITNCETLLKTGKIAEAYAVLGLALINQGHVGFSREPVAVAMAKTGKVLDEALHLFPAFGSGYALRGLASLIYKYDWTAAESDMRKALELSPDNELGHCFLSHLLVAQGRFDSGLTHAQRASEIDYASPMTVATEAWMMLLAGRVGDAVAKGEDVVDRFGQAAPARVLLGHAYRAAGLAGKAIEQYRGALEIEFHPEAHASLGFIFGEAGRRDEALLCLGTIRKAKEAGTLAYASSYFDALVYAGLRDRRRALQALDRAFEEQCDWLIYLAVEPRWNALRNEPQFRRLLTRVGLSAGSKPKART